MRASCSNFTVPLFVEGGKGGGVWITFHERKNSHFTFHRSKISNFTKFNELVFNCVNLMPFLTRQPMFTL